MASFSFTIEVAMKNGFCNFLGWVILFLLTVCGADAQVSNTGAVLEGTVHDSSGAVVPHATSVVA